MLYLFTGTDERAVRTKAHAWIAAARTKAPDLSFIVPDLGTLTHDALDTLLGTQGLFVMKTLVCLDDPFSIPSVGNLVLEKAPTCAQAQTVVVVIAPALPASARKKLEPHAARVFSYDRARNTDRGFNTALITALKTRNAASLWKEVVCALRQGDAPQAVHGPMHWQLRELMKRPSRLWSLADARQRSRELITLLSAEGYATLPLPLSLERFALSIEDPKH